MRRANFFRTHPGKRIAQFFRRITHPDKRALKRTTYRLALAAVFTALTFVATIVISVPIPATGGYVNVGDTMIFVAGTLFGPFVGGVAGGLGSMVADLVLGYAFYAPFTLLIKGLEGVLCGFLGYALAKKIKRKFPKYALQFASFVISGLLMCAGYFFLEFGYYDIGGALGGLPGNLIQAFSSVALASALVFFCQLGERVVRKSFPPKTTPGSPESEPEATDGARDREANEPETTNGARDLGNNEPETADRRKNDASLESKNPNGADADDAASVPETTRGADDATAEPKISRGTRNSEANEPETTDYAKLNDPELQSKD